MDFSPKRLQELAGHIRLMRRFAIGEHGFFAHHLGFLCYVALKDFRHGSLFDAEPGNFVRRKLFPLHSTTMVFTEKRGEKAFSPTLLEILAQIPQEMLRRVVAFEIVEGSLDYPIVSVRPNNLLDIRGHWSAHVTLYERPRRRKFAPESEPKHQPGFELHLTNSNCSPHRLFSR